ncbi:MAG: recombinase family protein [Sulfitobacter sp.]
MISKTINRKICACQIILYRRASTKAQANTSYKDQLNTIKTIYPDFSITHSTIDHIAEAMSGRADAEKRFASGLGKALRRLKRQPDTILLISELTRLARRTDVFTLIKAQGLGHRIYDATTGLCLNDSIKLGAHTVIEEQTKKQRASRIRGMVRLMKDGGDMGNHNIASQSVIGISTKARIAKKRAADVLAALSQMVIFYRGRTPSYEEICDELDRREIRTGQGNFFTPERLAQFKKNDTRKWNYALDSYHRPRRRLRRVLFHTAVELYKRRRCRRQMKFLLFAIAYKLVWAELSHSEWANRASDTLCQTPRRHRMVRRTDGCRGPPNGLSTTCTVEV